MNANLSNRQALYPESAHPKVARNLVDERDSRLSQVLFQRHPHRFHSFAVLESNILAVESGLLFTNKVHNLVALVGPSGWGKTHLLDAIAHKLVEEGSNPVIASATDWALGSSRIDPLETLLLDNAHEGFALTRVRQAMRIGLERRVRSEKPTVISFTNGLTSRQLRSFLPSGRHWRIAPIEPPTSSERVLVVEQIARGEGLALNALLVKMIAARVRGNGRTLVGVVKRLKLDGSDWTESDALVRSCGAIMPFVSDGNGWDPRDSLYKAVEVSTFSMPKKDSDSFAIYVMLRIARLSEALVAGYFAIDPAEAYSRASAFANSLENSTKSQLILKKILTDATDRLIYD